MPVSHQDGKQASARSLFLAITVLAACLLIPAFRPVAWVFASLLAVLPIGVAAYLARRHRS